MKKWVSGWLVVAVVALQGCGGAVNFSGAGSVKSASLGRLAVSNHADYLATKQDEDEKFERLVAKEPPFDLNAKVGSLSGSDEVSDLVYDVSDAARDALLTRVTFTLGQKYNVEMQFLSPRKSFFVVNLVKRPYLMSVLASRDGKRVFASEGLPFPGDFLIALLDTRKATGYLDRAWDRQVAFLEEQARQQEEKRKRDAEAELARIAEQKRREEAQAAAQAAAERAQEERRVQLEEARRREQLALAEREAKVQAMREETERRRQEREAQAQANRLANQKANDERQAKLAANQQAFEARQLNNQRARDAVQGQLMAAREDVALGRQRAEARADAYMASNWRPNPMFRQDQNDAAFRFERNKILGRFIEEERQAFGAANRLR
jgi:chemotaxis protein histidine kinase CheA